MTRILVAALLTAVALPAAAQDRVRYSAPERVASMGGPIENQVYAPGLPGVGSSAGITTDRPSGPGGLSNGVGAVGTLMPNSSSSNGQLLNDQGNGIGFQFGAPRRFVD
ncbi:hypothetical protein [Aureimonas psammosilenae]|uniref:hypothetical protein n=1 Tax=Aureimonas psammosilenae TaxID=2495496 RepID=UPI0012606B30|nr:hypothetical protein [Aureimonas psammosilenae]